MGKVVVDLDEDNAAGVVDEDGRIAAAAELPADVVDEDVDPLDRLPAHAVTNADGTVTLPLKFPVELQIRKDGKIRVDRYAELTFHRLTGADFRAVNAVSDDLQSVVAFGRSTRKNQAVMNALYDRMDGADIAAAGQVLNSFFATGRRTGR